MIEKRWIIEDDEPLQIIDSKGEYEAVCVLYSEDAHQVMDLLNQKEEQIEYWRKIVIELIWHYEDKEKWKEMYNHYDRVGKDDEITEKRCHICGKEEV